MALKSFAVQTKNYQVGVNVIPEQIVPLGVTRAEIALDTANWTNPASRLLLALEESYDGGATWMGGGAVDMQPREDGTFRDRTGAILATATAAFTWRPGATHIRGSFTIVGASIRTGGFVEVW